MTKRLDVNDYFSNISADYARYRPTYPQALFALISEYVPAHDLAWDCATGSGQAAVGLSRRFLKVVATDASDEQLSHATPVGNVEYRVAPAENSGIQSASVNAVTVAQALHWFDLDQFYTEVRRVCTRGAVLAISFYYGLDLSFEPSIDKVLRRLDEELLERYWPPESAKVPKSESSSFIRQRSIRSLPSRSMRYQLLLSRSRCTGILAS